MFPSKPSIWWYPHFRKPHLVVPPFQETTIWLTIVSDNRRPMATKMPYDRYPFIRFSRFFLVYIQYTPCSSTATGPPKVLHWNWSSPWSPEEAVVLLGRRLRACRSRSRLVTLSTFYGDLWGFLGINEGFIRFYKDSKGLSDHMGVSWNGGTPIAGW